VGVLIVLVQGVAIGRITARWRDSPLLIAAMSFTFLGLVVWAFSSNIPILLVSMVPLALGAGIFNTVINTALSKAVYPEEVGETLGLSASYESLTRVIAPTAAGWLLGALGASVPGLFGAGILLLLIPYGYQRLIANPPAPLPTRT
jgi:DHA1 family tetracycline resistance protein-like MFS transporter